ncbi:hypothetical protein [Novosphingobium album (ex Liu et al. 2023)]|uniref:Uncharacterized protein n=1 Tax=Novosphingobium album (ex Liu et al. 2023) TaxID=3031130 RepID=A0ABT5WX96_9SPHN|nr:hypothetical protein [Novosphingobium album (ex Liu et al. 2023)]MDE8654471.1 hypothetical protein [Novosphingobium album (ex Liu et al. 2023)]
MKSSLASVIVIAMAVVPLAASARPATREDAARAAIHPVATSEDMRTWLARVPMTREFPPDFAETLTSAAPYSVIEMTTAPGCVPCADLWTKLAVFRARYHWQIRTISGEEALLRSGRLGLPWVGHPVAWVRPASDQGRTIPIAVGTDHFVNIARNTYLGAKMLGGVRPEVGLRAMAKYTGIVGSALRRPRS